MDAIEKRLTIVEERHDRADQARRELEKSLLDKLTAIEEAIKALTSVVQSQGQALTSQEQRNNLQDAEVAELRKHVREIVRDVLSSGAVTAGKAGGAVGGVLAFLWAVFEVWVKYGG